MDDDDEDRLANLAVYGTPDVPPPRGGRLQLVPLPASPLILRRARLPDVETIPPRPWLLGNWFLRGFVSVLVAPGGTGKSVFAMTAALSIATAKPLLGLKVWEQANVSIFNEDPMDELERRLGAALMRHQIDPGIVEERYFLNSMDERMLIMAARDADGFDVIHPDEDALVAQLIANHIGMVIVDPYAESHTLEENSNPDMLKAAAAWRRVARRANCAVLLVHHVRKGADGAGIDAARGAKGLTDSARVGLVMQVMTDLEAEQFGIGADERSQYVRVDNSKANLSPRDKATWFRLETVKLNNGDATYPNGDSVAAMVHWTPDGLFTKQSDPALNECLDEISRGPEEGVLYTAHKRGTTDRWAGIVLIERLAINEAQAKAMLQAWLATGLLSTVEFKHPTARRVMVGLRVDALRRPGL